MPKPEVKPKTFGFTLQLVQALTLTTEVSSPPGGGGPIYNPEPIIGFHGIKA